MKLRATKKEMRDGYFYIISAGYCSMQYLLRDKNPIAYSAGVYGWSCDYYEIDNVLISTGYSPLSEKNTRRDYEQLKYFEDQAQAICYDRNANYEKDKIRIDELLREYIKQCKL